jgi:ABC-type sugar transport system ATPase subunit
MTPPAGLFFDDVSLHAGEFRLDELSFEVPPGAYAILMGATGSGKTTILEATCGLRPTTRGRISIGTERIDTLRPADRVIGYVPQDGALFPTMTARSQIALPLEVRGTPRAEAYERAKELARIVKVEHLLDRRPAGFSGGERQRVAIARAIAHPPRLLLMDEPIGALDEVMRERVINALRSVHELTGVTTIHVTHDPRDAEELGSIRLRVEEGKVHAC